MTNLACPNDRCRYVSPDCDRQGRASGAGMHRSHRKSRPRVDFCGTLAEVLIVAGRKDITTTMSNFLADLTLEVVPGDAAAAQFVGAIYRKWGKPNHPASLNFGDRFAYALAKERDCPLLFIGNDFSQTDIVAAI